MTLVRDIAAPIEPVTVTVTGQEVFDLFEAHPDLLAVAVVDADRRPIGLVERQSFILTFAARYGRALYAGRSISMLMNPEPIVVEGAMPVSDFLARSLHKRNSELMKGFIVVDHGAYRGVGAAIDLLREISAENAHRAEEQAALNQVLAQAHLEAANAHARLRQAVDVMPEGLAFFDADDRLVLWNRRYADLHPAIAHKLAPGISFLDILKVGLEVGEFVDAVGREDAWIAERIALRAQGACTFEQALRQGRWIRIEERALPSGQRINVMVDITELKQREASFQLLFEGNPIPMAVFDAETFELRAINASAEIQYGYPRDAVIGRPANAFVAAGQDPLTVERMGESLQAHRVRETRRHVTADGREIEVQAYIQAMTWAGRPSVMAALIDVTDAKAAESELERTRGFLDAVIETMPAMLVVKETKEHRLVMINKAGEDLLGVPRAELLGKNDHDLFAKEQADFFVSIDKAVLESGQIQVIEEEPIQTRHKGERWLTTKKVAMPGPDGQPEHLLIICQDITEQRQGVHALTEARDAAEAANRSKSAFLANMSHEIRTPLNGVIGLADTLARTSLDGPQREMVEVVRSSAETLERILSDVLDLARVESGRIEIQNEPFHVGEAVRDIARLCQPAADDKGVLLTVDLDPAIDRMGLGDAVRVRQVLTNLMSNAVKFTSVGEVRLSAAPDGEGGRVLFQVRDTGVGFDADQRQAIFGRFQQADGSITRRFGGTGLGLAISRELAELMGAELDCDSTPGIGSTFTFRVTLAPVEAAPAPGPADPDRDAAVQSARLRVLLADDHPVNRQVVQLMLADAEIDLHMAENGREALDAFLICPFDLVLMDMQMPVMDGLTAVREIRAAEARSGAARTPIIMLTANAMSDHVKQSLEAGADLHLGKPIRAETLYKAMSRVLETAQPQASSAAHAAA